MYNQLIDKIKKDSKNWDMHKECFVEKEVPPRTILLREGDVATHLFFIKKGCIRLWFNKDGKDISVDFFFEGHGVSCIDSMIGNKPSLLSIETVEPCTIISLEKKDLELILLKNPGLRENMLEILFKRFENYAHLFLSRIRDTPQERYHNLVKSHPEIIKRVPQHYIASYLGITPTSLSRIRNRK